MSLMLQAYEGYLEEGRFYPVGSPVGLLGRRRVIVTVIDGQPPENETVPEHAETEQASAWRMFFEAVNASDEIIPANFERVNFAREVES